MFLKDGVSSIPRLARLATEVGKCEYCLICGFLLWEVFDTIELNFLEEFRVIMRNFVIILIAFVVLNLCAVAAFAQKDNSAGVSLTGARAESMALLEDAATKVVSLAEAIPEDKYGWRPGEGVRSVSEVFMHIAAANYLLPTFIGVKADGFEGRAAFQRMQEMEKITAKAKVIEHLKKSFEHARYAIRSTKDSDLNKNVKFFGNETTYRGMLNILATHCHEHLGQAIAYSRVNKIVPPWSVRAGSE